MSTNTWFQIQQSMVPGVRSFIIPVQREREREVSEGFVCWSDDLGMGNGWGKKAPGVVHFSSPALYKSS